MKRALIIIAVLMASGTASYASPISQQWIKAYGNANYQINCIQQTMDGGYVAAGHKRYEPESPIDLLILKLDVNGNISWQKTYRYSTWINEAYTIQQTADGGYIVAGFTSLGGGEGWILKLDSNGNILWQKAFDGLAQFTSIQQTADGGYIALGGYPPNQVVVTKLNSTGDVIWAKVYFLASHAEGQNVLQTDDGGYIVTMQAYITDKYDLCILKLDSNGDIIWQKLYENNYVAISIQQTSDEGYIVAGDFSALKLNADGGILWERYYGYDIFGITQAMDGGYTAVGKCYENLMDDILVLHLDSGGNIIWQKAYGGPNAEIGWYSGKTIDGGIIIAGSTYGDYAPSAFMLLKLNSNGEIPDCDYMYTPDVEVFNGNMAVQNINATVESFSLTVTDTDTIPQDISLDTSVLCYYEDPNDIDGDGVEFNPGGMMASSMQSGSFLADADNCSDMPNGPYLGTCTEGNVGSTCIADAACGVNEFCSMAQEDTYPPQGNDIGDACDCEGNFDCNTTVDGMDAATFKADYGRSGISDPCNAENPCNGDFSCNGNVDGTDAALFKQDFGRSGIHNPCPACGGTDPWCVYP